MTPQNGRNVLYWGRTDPDYSRTRVVREAFDTLGWSAQFFHPCMSKLGHAEASLRRVCKPDMVWVMCFRQRDLCAACRWASKRGIPVVFDALISAYDKRVFERGKFKAGSLRARQLLAWEQNVLAQPDVIVVDTQAHATFFHDTLGVPSNKLVIVPVGAETSLFEPAPESRTLDDRPCEVLFYGSFIGLQGPEIIVQAATRCPEANFVLLGNGPLKARCKNAAKGAANITFKDPVPYSQLPKIIHQADILLGIFGHSDKASRVIPNKVYQALACGKPVLTRKSQAYPQELQHMETRDSGMGFLPADDPQSLADSVRQLCRNPASLNALGNASRQTYERWFSSSAVHESLQHVLKKSVG